MLGVAYIMQAIVWDCINRRGDLYQYTVTYNVGIYGWMVCGYTTIINHDAKLVLLPYSPPLPSFLIIQTKNDYIAVFLNNEALSY